MKLFFHNTYVTPDYPEEDFSPINLQEAIEKTRRDLEIAYAGFDNAIEIDLIDSYIYEINALQKRYNHLVTLATETGVETSRSHKHSPIRTLVSHVFG